MRVRVLGPIGLEANGQPVTVGGPQQRRLLAIMVASNGEVVTTDRLVEMLWPNTDAPAGATRTAMSYVSRLRAALGDTAIVTRNAGYFLSPEHLWCDRDEFVELLDLARRSLPDIAIGTYERALALWRGPPYGEFTSDWWALADAARLSELRIVAQEERAAALIAMGQFNRAIPDLEALVVGHPLRERPMALLMQALDASGRHPEALRAARRFRAALVEQTGLQPSSTFAALENSIVAGSGPGRAPIDVPLRGYTIHEMIGTGAHGSVYSATQPGTNRSVAIKVIRSELADSADFIRRFETEAQLIARLEHPHIVPLYDYWREPGGAFLVLRLLPGGAVRDAVLRDGPWGIARVSRLVEEVGGALIAAHAAGVSHMAVRASNVLLDDDGASYLTDFAIASCGHDLDQRVDVQGFGCMIRELLTGAPADEGNVPRLPAAIDAVLTRAASAGRRPSSIADLVLAWRTAAGTADDVSVGRLVPPGGDMARPANRLATAVSATANPYVGLRAFDEADAARFFGRTTITEALARAVDEHPLTTVVGPSGSGKSSLVRAGLAPQLRLAGRTVLVTTPADDPVGALLGAVDEVSTRRSARGSLLERLVDLARNAPLVVVLDQFEELWIRCDPEVRTTFTELIADAATHSEAAVRIVATIRADTFDRPLQEQRLGPLVGEGAFVVTALSPAELGDAIRRPAERAGVAFDDAVVAGLVAEAAAQPGSLPMLQFALAGLYENRVAGRVTAEVFERYGGIGEAIGRRAEEIYTSFDDEARVAIRTVFERLVELDGAGFKGRRRVRVGEVGDDARAVVDAFTDARLLVTDRDPATREPTIEIAHDALLERWDRLAGWIAADRQWIDDVQRLSIAARAWNEGGRKDADLYRGARLATIVEALEREGRTVSPVERAFVDAGVAARDADIRAAQRSARRLRRLLAGAVAALVVAVIAGGVAAVQRSRAQRSTTTARIEALVGRAESLRVTQRDAAALLAIEAFRLADNPRTRSALLVTFTTGDGFLDAHRYDAASGGSGIVLPDGRTAFLADGDGHVRPYDLDTGGLGPPLVRVDATGAPPVLVASPGGDVLAVLARSEQGTAASTVTLLELTTATPRFTIEIEGHAEAGAFSSDGARLAVVDDTARLMVLETATGSEAGTIPGPQRGDGGAPPLRPDDQRDLLYFEGPSSGLLTVGGEFVVGSVDGRLQFFDTKTLAPTRRVFVAANTVSTLGDVGDGTIVTAGREGVARVEVVRGEVAWRHAELETCTTLAVAPALGTFYCADPFGRLVERDLDTGLPLRDLDAQNGATRALALTRDHTELVAFGGSEPVVARWRLDGSGPITTLVAPGYDVGIGFAPDGRRLIVGAGSTIETAVYRVVDVESGNFVADLRPTFDGIFVDDDTIAAGLLDDAGEIRLATFELGGGGPPDVTVGDAIAVEEDDLVDVEPLRQHLLVGRRNGATFELATYDWTARKTGPTISVDDVVSTAISRTGHRIAVGTTTGVALYDGGSGVVLGEIDVPVLQSVAITLADQLFVSSLGGELTMYDIDTLRPVRTFGGSRGIVQDLYGSSDGSIIALRGGDRTVTLHDVATGSILGAPIDVPRGAPNLMLLSPGGDRLAVGGGERGVQIWDLEPERWIAAACGVAGRNLTVEEWDAHIGDLAPYRRTCGP